MGNSIANKIATPFGLAMTGLNASNDVLFVIARKPKQTRGFLALLGTGSAISRGIL